MLEISPQRELKNDTVQYTSNKRYKSVLLCRAIYGPEERRLHYRGHDVTDVEVFKATQKRGVTRSIRRELKRRNAIEPIIGHLKNDGLMHRNYLKGSQGDAIDVIPCGAGQNLRLILRHLRIFWLEIRQAFMHTPLLYSPGTT